MELAWVLTIYCLRNEGLVRELRLSGANHSTSCSELALLTPRVRPGQGRRCV